MPIQNNRLPETVYTPDSQLKHPGSLLKSMGRDLLISRELAWRIFLRNVSAQYRQTLLGYIWAFVPPVFTAVLFVFLNEKKVFAVQQTHIPYPAFALIGTLLWQVFADALNSPLKMVNQSRSFLAKLNFPREALILAGLYEVGFNITIRLILFIFVYYWFGIPVPATVLLTPIGILALVLLGLMFGIMLTPVGILFRDIEKGLPLVTTVWMFLTPVVYPMPATGSTSWIFDLNPVSPLLTTTRLMLTGGQPESITPFFFLSVATIFLVGAGWFFYRLAIPHLVERMSA